jgi:hypothetical protein
MLNYFTLVHIPNSSLPAISPSSHAQVFDFATGLPLPEGQAGIV